MLSHSSSLSHPRDLSLFFCFCTSVKRENRRKTKARREKNPKTLSVSLSSRLTYFFTYGASRTSSALRAGPPPSG